jgi:copper oxidase (laccase) domain-containing protein
MFRAISSIEKSKEILVDLFPSIKSLEYDVREDLMAELSDT